MDGISISGGEELKAEAYEACEIPLPVIEKMIKKGVWKGSLEEEEVLYNLENNLYDKEYAENVKKLISV